MNRISLALLLAAVLALPSHVDALCMAPQPEHAQLITPSLTVVPPGGGFVVRGSELVSPNLTLSGPSTVTVTGTEIAPNVLRFVLPRTIAPGRYDIAATYRGTPGSIGGIEVSTTAAPLAPPAAAPAGTLTHTVSPSRRGEMHTVALTLGTSVPRGMAVVFDWNASHHQFGSVAWVNAQTRDAALGGTGRCGGYPYGATLPAPGDSVRAAFVDERGQVGPWASFTVR